MFGKAHINCKNPRVRHGSKIIVAWAWEEKVKWQLRGNSDKNLHKLEHINAKEEEDFTTM